MMRRAPGIPRPMALPLMERNTGPALATVGRPCRAQPNPIPEASTPGQRAAALASAGHVQCSSGQHE